MHRLSIVERLHSKAILLYLCPNYSTICVFVRRTRVSLPIDHLCEGHQHKGLKATRSTSARSEPIMLGYSCFNRIIMIASHLTCALPRIASMSDMIVGQLSARSIVHANVSSLQIATAVLVIFIVVAGLPFALGYVWFLYRRRLQRHERDAHDESIGLMTLDSTLPVGLGIRNSSCAENASADVEGSLSASTVLSPKSPKLTLLTPSHWPSKSAPGPKDNILDRRGKTPLQCDTTAQYAIDAVLTGSMMPGSCLANRLQLLPVYGFDEATITPPIGSPLWRRKLELGRCSRIAKAHNEIETFKSGSYYIFGLHGWSKNKSE